MKGIKSAEALHCFFKDRFCTRGDIGNLYTRPLSKTSEPLSFT